MNGASPPDGSLKMERKLLAPKTGTRCLFFAGKGYRTQVLTADPASHMQESFGQLPGDEPRQVTALAKISLRPGSTLKQCGRINTARILPAVKDEAEEMKTAVQENPRSPCAQEIVTFEKSTSRSSSTPR